MKTFILTCLTALGLISFVGCSCDNDKHSTTTESASMQTDTKDVHPAR